MSYSQRSELRVDQANSLEGAVPYVWSNIGSVVSRARQYVHNAAETRLEAMRNYVDSRAQQLFEERPQHIEDRFKEHYRAHFRDRMLEQIKCIKSYHALLRENGEDIGLDPAAMEYATNGLAERFAVEYKDKVISEIAREEAEKEQRLRSLRLVALRYISDLTAQ